MATITKLMVYNGALRLLGERPLATVSESREPRRILDTVWDDGAVDHCLEQGQWVFATRAVKMEYSPSVEPPFGYSRAFDKPVDFVRTAAVCSDEYFNSPLTQYSDEDGFWFSDLDTIYVKYVSNDNAYGNDMSLWPRTFLAYIQAHMAMEACMPLTQNESKFGTLLKLTDKRLVDARSKDALSQPTKFMPQGSWTASRGSGSRRYDRGSR